MRNVRLLAAARPPPTIAPICTMGPSGPKAKHEEYEKIIDTSFPTNVFKLIVFIIRTPLR
jgi:hypothetical protein